MLKGKTVVLGVCGSIAAYKTANLASALKKLGADVHVIMTKNATNIDVYKRQSRNFANKVWNASRFIMMNLDAADVPETIDKNELTIADKWILAKANRLIADVTDNMEKYELGIALSKVYDFIWEEFCDWYIEMVKPVSYTHLDVYKRQPLHRY